MNPGSSARPVLVTGASGFLGGRLAQMLVERGEDVVVLAREQSDLRHLLGLPLRVARGDLTDKKALMGAASGVGRIFHCAAASTDWASWETYHGANVLGTENLLRAAMDAGTVERFVHVSTTDVYGYPLEPCDETSPPRDAGLPYNRTKRLGEEAVWKAYRDGALPVSVVRPATIYGPRGKDFVLEIGRLLRQRVMAYVDRGRATGGFTYVDNVAAAMMAASVSPEAVGQAYNISDQTGAAWREYVSAFAREIGAPEPWISLPFGVAMRLGSAMEGLHRALGLRGRPLLTRHAVLLLARDQEFPAGKAVRDFGFSPEVSLPEGIRRSAEWFVGQEKRR